MKNKLQKFSLGTWNVRMVYTAETMTTVVSTLERYLCEIIAIQEIRWTKIGTSHFASKSFL